MTGSINEPLEVLAAVAALLRRYQGSYNVLHAAELVACFDSALYYQERMTRCDTAEDDLDLLSRATRWRATDGLVVEFGVASGRTINHLARLLPGEQVFGFDSFEGLPEVWRTGFGLGTFAQEPPALRENVTVIKGRFEDTLPRFVAAQQGPVSLIHVDCDLYSSTRVAFSSLAECIVKGTVIVFDEYFNYPSWRQHEYRAFQEFVTRHQRTYEYMGFVPKHQQVCVRMLD